MLFMLWTACRLLPSDLCDLQEHPFIQQTERISCCGLLGPADRFCACWGTSWLYGLHMNSGITILNPGSNIWQQDLSLTSASHRHDMAYPLTAKCCSFGIIQAWEKWNRIIDMLPVVDRNTWVSPGSMTKRLILKMWGFFQFENANPYFQFQLNSSRAVKYRSPIRTLLTTVKSLFPTGAPHRSCANKVLPSSYVQPDNKDFSQLGNDLFGNKYIIVSSICK